MMKGIFFKFNMRRLLEQGMTEEQALAECERRHKIAEQVPCDFGPDWIDSPDTVREHFRKHPEEREM